MTSYAGEPCPVDKVQGQAFRLSSPLLPLLPLFLTEHFAILNDGCGTKSLRLVTWKPVRGIASCLFPARLIIKNK